MTYLFSGSTSMQCRLNHALNVHQFMVSVGKNKNAHTHTPTHTHTRTHTYTHTHTATASLFLNGLSTHQLRFFEQEHGKKIIIAPNLEF